MLTHIIMKKNLKQRITKTAFKTINFNKYKDCLDDRHIEQDKIENVTI